MVERVKLEITKAFSLFNKKDKIEMQDIRIKIVKNNGSLEYTLMQKDSETNSVRKIRPTTLAEMIGFMYAMVAESKLYGSIKEVLKENNLEETQAYVVLSPLADYSPSASLISNGRMIKKIEIEKLIN